MLTFFFQKSHDTMFLICSKYHLDSKTFFGDLANHPAVIRAGGNKQGSLCGVSDVTGDKWHAICDMWHMTHDTWHLKPDAYLLKIFSIGADSTRWDVQRLRYTECLVTSILNQIAEMKQPAVQNNAKNARSFQWAVFKQTNKIPLFHLNNF